MSIKKVLLPLLLTFNIVFTQYPSASFEKDKYLINENLERTSVTLQIENPELVNWRGLNIFLYADPLVIDLLSVSWNIETPFQHEFFDYNIHNDTLKIYAFDTEDVYDSGGKIFDISFDIVGEENDSTLIEFIGFQFQASYLENTIPTNIILVGGVNCNDDIACNYNEGSSSNEDCIYFSEGECDCFGTLIDECDVCDGDAYLSLCFGTDDCENMDCDGDCKINGEEFLVIDKCGVCGGGNYESLCIGTDDCVVMDCAGVCNGSDLLTPCGDCSDVSSCNFSIGIATMDNNFRSDNIEIPISLNNFEESFEGMEFTVSFESELLRINNNIETASLNENISYTFSEDPPGIINGLLFAIGDIDSHLDGPIVNLSFDVIDTFYTSELHEYPSPLSIEVTSLNTSLNGINILQGNIEDTSTLTIYTRACIDPFASTFDSNFICEVYEDVCDGNGILEGSHIFNSGCDLPLPDFEDILNGESVATEEGIYQNLAYTLIIPEGTEVTFPDGEIAPLDLISSNSVNINFLPDFSPDAQLAGSLVGLYPFRTTFDPPAPYCTDGTSQTKEVCCIDNDGTWEEEESDCTSGSEIWMEPVVEFLFTFEEMSGSSGYEILYIDDIDHFYKDGDILQIGDWEVLGTCSGEALGFCKISDLGKSGLFMVMNSGNLAIDEFTTIPSDYNLYRSYPNPFNPTTTLEFDVSNSGIVNFTVYNIHGQIVESISSKFYTPGNYRIKWEARNIPSGIYLIQMKTEESAHVQKVMLLK